MKKLGAELKQSSNKLGHLPAGNVAYLFVEPVVELFMLVGGLVTFVARASSEAFSGETNQNYIVCRLV